MKKQLTIFLTVLLLFTSCVKGRASNAPTAGKIEDNLYTATYMNLQFTANENWQLSSAREVAEITANNLADGTILDMQATYIYDANASSQTTPLTYTISVYYISKVQNGATFTTAAAYLENHRSAIISTQATLNSIYETTDIAPFTLASQDYVYYANHISAAQTTCYYFAKDVDENYILLISMQLPSDLSIVQVTNMFTALQ